MRRRDRQIPEEQAWEILDRCDYAVLAMTAEDGTPYGLPLNVVREGRVVYFHGAQAGRKAACLQKAPRVCLTCVETCEIVPERYTTRYASAVAFGRVEEITEPEEDEEEAAAAAAEKTTFWGRIAQMFKDLWVAVTGLFGGKD